MKKRLISFLLMVVMLVSLCSVIPVSASADAQVTTVTVAQGDTVLKLCQNLGVDFYTYKGLIMKLNGFTSESAFNKIGVGTKISLPISNQAAANLAGTVGTTTAAGATTASGSTGTGLTVGTVSSLPTGDYVAYYLVGYTVQSGETLSSIYSSMGQSYKTYANQICKLNNLSSVNSIQANKTILLPTTSATVNGTGVTTVMAHVMKSNENAYNIVCSDYGLNYSSVQTMLQALNNRTNMGVFRVGEILYIPVSGVVSANTTINGGTGSVSGSTTGSVSTSGAYNLVAQTPTNGSFDLQVSGKSVKSATSGQTVNVVTTPDTGYAVDSIKVTKVGDSNTSVTVNNGSFVMPAYSVTVSVTFKQAKQSDITVDASANGAVTVMVDNSSVSKAYAGNKVTVRTTPNAGFMLDHVRVTYNDYRDSIAVENNTFTMPNFGVTVTATFKVDPDYNAASGNKIYTDVSNATISTKIGEKTVDAAKSGERVTLTVTPKDNYTLESIKVYYDNFKKTVPIDNMAFTMPDEPVTVVAVVKPTADAVFALNVIENSEGKVKLLVDGKEATSAKAGQTVKIEATSNRDFYYFLSTVTKVGDSSVSINLGEDNTFTMPAHAVDVRVKFYLYHNIVLGSSSSGSYNVTSVLDGRTVNRCAAGVVLQVNTWGIADKMAQGNIVLTYSDGSTYTLTDTNQFVMPDCDVRVNVNFTKQTTLVAHSIGDDTGKYTNWGNTYSVLGRTLNDKGKYPLEIAVGRGNSVTISPAANIGYAVDEIWYKHGSTTEKVTYSAVSGGYKFVVPDVDKVELYVSFKEMTRYAVDIKYTDKDEKVGSAEVYTALASVTEAAPGSLMWLRVKTNANYDFDWSKVVIRKYDSSKKDFNGNVSVSAMDDITKSVSFDPVEHTFTMPYEPGYPVIVDLSDAFVSNLHVIKYHRVTSEETGNAAKGTINVTIDNVTYSNFTGKDGLCTLMDGSSAKNVKAGTCVYVTHESQPGYYLDHIEVKYDNTSGDTVKVNVVNDTTCYFTMPYDNVIITPVYEDDYYSIIATESQHGTYTVGANAKVGQNENNLIANIKPDDGYQLGSVTLSYTDARGNAVEDYEVKATDLGLYYADPGLLPKSAVTVKVNFVPVKQEGLRVQYEFDDGVIINPSLNYTVDLFIGENKLPITRGTLIDTVNDSDLVVTDSTVIIRRTTENIDSNFEIENIWVIYNGGKDAATRYTNGDYHFTMPNIEKDGCVIHVKFKLKDAAKYTITPEIVGGTALINNVSIESGKSISAVLGSVVTLGNITPAEGYQFPATVTITADDVTKQYTIAETQAFGNATTGKKIATFLFGNISTGVEPYITVQPESPVTVKVEFAKTPAPKYTLTTNGIGTDGVKLIIGDTTYESDIEDSSLELEENTELKVAIDSTEKRIASVKISSGEQEETKCPTAGESEVTLNMYGGATTLNVATEDIPAEPIEMKVDCKDPLKFDTASCVRVTTTADGKYTVVPGSDVRVSFKPTADADTYDSYADITLKINGKTIEQKANVFVDVSESTGTYAWDFHVPDDANEVEVKVTLEKNKHNVNVSYVDGSVADAKVVCPEKAVSNEKITVKAPEGMKISYYTGSYTSKPTDTNTEGKEVQFSWEAGNTGSDDKYESLWLQLGELKEGSEIKLNVKLQELTETPAKGEATT